MRKGYRNKDEYKVYAVTQDPRLANIWIESENRYSDSPDVIIVQGFASRALAEAYAKEQIRDVRGHHVKLATGTALRKMGVNPKLDLNWSSVLRPFSFPSDLSREQVAEVDGIAISNADEAFDQVGDYENLQAALDAYWDNASDTLLEHGYSPQDPDHSRFEDAVRWLARTFGRESLLVGTMFGPQPSRYEE